MGKRRKLHEMSRENDIRYLGPISYQGFQFLGWTCILLTSVVLMLQIGIRLKPESAEKSYSLMMLLGYAGSLSLPFLLIANFSRILSNNEGYKKQLLRNGGAALGIFALVFVFFSRYVVSSLQRFVTDPQEVVPVMTESFRMIKKEGFLAFNLFVDLFLCTLFMYFLNAQPPRFLAGRKSFLFRLMAIPPVAYEVISMLLKGQAAAGKITLPLWSFPLLTVKPPMTFAVFMVLAVYIKTRELRFRRHGKTHEEYQEFLKTNRNSLHFSVFLFITMVVAALLDLVILSLLTYASGGNAILEGNSDVVLRHATVGIAMGFGESVPLLLAAPFVLLYSYTRIPKRKIISTIIPAAGIVLMIILFLETVYMGMGMLAERTEPLPLRELMDTMKTGMPAGT